MKDKRPRLDERETYDTPVGKEPNKANPVGTAVLILLFVWAIIILIAYAS